jgi:hypothetical protein
MSQVQHEGASEMRGSGPVGCQPPRRYHQHGSRLCGFPPEVICRSIFDRSGRSVQRPGADLVDCGGPSEVAGEHFRGIRARWCERFACCQIVKALWLGAPQIVRACARDMPTDAEASLEFDSSDSPPCT